MTDELRETVKEKCPDCDGFAYGCWTCNGTGFIEDKVLEAELREVVDSIWDFVYDRHKERDEYLSTDTIQKFVGSFIRPLFEKCEVERQLLLKIDMAIDPLLQAIGRADTRAIEGLTRIINESRDKIKALRSPQPELTHGT